MNAFYRAGGFAGLRKKLRENGRTLRRIGRELRTLRAKIERQKRRT